MKILVLQLARYGDIFMTLPVIRALRAQNPQVQIHGLFRQRFVEAASLFQKNGCDWDQIYTLPSHEIFEQILTYKNSEEALRIIDTWADKIQSENYDFIYNFSFSPVSSYLVNRLRSSKTVIKGYQRHTDGYLALLDDVSRYFYAQVGPERANRLHLIDIMAQLISVDVQTEHRRFPLSGHRNTTLQKFDLLRKDFILLHLGASEAHKSLSAEGWQRLIIGLKTFCPEFEIVIMGASEDAIKAEFLVSHLVTTRLKNIVGQTSWSEVRDIISAARLYIGADSGPLQLASLMNALVLNLSIGEVNFWETGPLAEKSQVLPYRHENEIDFHEVITTAQKMLRGTPLRSGYQAAETVPRFLKLNGPTDDFSWDLLQSIYLGASPPLADSLSFIECVGQLSELNQLALEKISAQVSLNFLGPYLDRIYETMNLVATKNSAAGVFVRWLRAEKCIVPPGTTEQILKYYLEIHIGFSKLIRPYVMESEKDSGVMSNG